MSRAALPVATGHAGRLGQRGGLAALDLDGGHGMRGARTGLACGAAPGDPEPRTRTGRLPAGRAATWPPPASRALRYSLRSVPRVPTGPPPAALDPAVVQEARRHRSPGAGEEQRPTSSQHEEARP